MSADILCLHCNSEKFNTQHISLPNRGFHIKVSCASCGRFLKFLAHDAPRLHFGKHRGETVVAVAQKDPEYLKWCLSENVIKNTRLKDVIKGAVVSA